MAHDTSYTTSLIGSINDTAKSALRGVGFSKARFLDTVFDLAVVRGIDWTALSSDDLENLLQQLTAITNNGVKTLSCVPSA